MELQVLKGLVMVSVYLETDSVVTLDFVSINLDSIQKQEVLSELKSGLSRIQFEKGNHIINLVVPLARPFYMTMIRPFMLPKDHSYRKSLSNFYLVSASWLWRMDTWGVASNANRMLEIAFNLLINQRIGENYLIVNESESGVHMYNEMGSSCIQYVIQKIEPELLIEVWTEPHDESIIDYSPSLGFHCTSSFVPSSIANLYHTDSRVLSCIYTFESIMASQVDEENALFSLSSFLGAGSSCPLTVYTLSLPSFLLDASKDSRLKYQQTYLALLNQSLQKTCLFELNIENYSSLTSVLQESIKDYSLLESNRAFIYKTSLDGFSRLPKLFPRCLKRILLLLFMIVIDQRYLMSNQPCWSHLFYQVYLSNFH